MAKEQSLRAEQENLLKEEMKKMEEQQKEAKQMAGLKGVFDEGNALFGEKK